MCMSIRVIQFFVFLNLGSTGAPPGYGTGSKVSPRLLGTRESSVAVNPAISYSLSFLRVSAYSRLSAALFSWPGSLQESKISQLP